MNITILGSGFAALTAVRTVRKQSPQANITVLSPKKELVYLPSLIWIPSGLKTGDDLRVDLSNFFARMKVSYVQTRVSDVQDGGRTVLTDNGEFKNDALIIATGGQFIKKLPGIEHAISICEGIEAAEKIKTRLEQMDGGTIAMGFGGNPKEPSAMRGGPMFELVFGIDTLLRKQSRRDKFNLIFFSPAPEPGKRLGAKVPVRLMERMQKLNIETKLGHKMIGFEADKVKTEAESFDADLILFMPGMTGPAWAAKGELPKSEGGLIAANEFCQVVGFEHTYVAGDSGSFPGPAWQAKQAHASDLQGEAAGYNAVAGLQGQSLKTFKHEIICIADTLDKGIFIKRTERGTTMLPPFRLMHYTKLLFEKMYLRKYR